MSKPLTAGEKARRANIRGLKAIGRRNDKLRAVAKTQRIAEHDARNEDRRLQAVADRATRIAAHQARNAKAALDARIDRELAALFTDADCAVTVTDRALLASLGMPPLAANDDQPLTQVA